MNNYNRLEANLVHALLEEQIKLGYYPNTVNLYYPVASIERILQTESRDELKTALGEFKGYVKERLGELQIKKLNDRLLFAIPPKGAEYVHTHYTDRAFLTELIALVQQHGVTMEEIKALFERYSNDIVIEKIESGEFDYAVYSPSHTPDEYIYCFKLEHHIIYHRFTREDYEELI